MPKIAIGLDARNRLIRALRVYTSELSEIVDAIKERVRYVGAKDEDYVPKDISDELQLATDSVRIVQSRDRDELQLFGVSLKDSHLRTIASALLLRQDDLTNRLHSVKSDLLSPPEASYPLETELATLGEEFTRFYEKYGQSDFLEELRSRRERKSGLAYPRTMDFAELIPQGEGQTLEFKEQFPDRPTISPKKLRRLRLPTLA